MKKSLIACLCGFSLFFVGCASKNVEQNDNTSITAPETTVESPEDESEKDSSTKDNEEAEQQDEETDESTNDDEVEDVNEDSVSVEFFPELEDIEEPTVITIDPPLEPEDDSELSTEESLEEEIDPTEVENDENLISESNEKFSESTDNVNDESNTEQTEETDETDDLLIADNSDDVIDITDEDSVETEQILEEETEIIPSRSVTLNKNEYLDISYPGNGWVFMGLTDGSKDLTYYGRKLGTGKTNFTLQAKNAGRKIVQFYKEDNLTNETLYDYIEVIVQNEKGSTKTHVEAPEYKLPYTEKAKEIIEKNNKKKEVIKEEVEISKSTETPSISVETVTKKTGSDSNNEVITSTEKYEQKVQQEDVKTEQPKNIDYKLLLKEAQVLYNEKEYEAANKKLDDFFEVALTKRDEGLYLRGQILEAKSNIQNIKNSIEAYTTLTKNYPASKYWEDANKRIIYLKRFYLEVR